VIDAGPTQRARRRRTALLAVIPALVPVIVFAKSLAGRKLLDPGDAYTYSLPIHELTTRALEAFHLPSWNPYSFSGSPLLATGQGGTYYPPNLLYLILPSFEANNVLTVLNISLAGVGAFLLARALTHDEAAAVVAGIAFASSGFMYGHIAHQQIEASGAWLPWVLYAYLLLRERFTPQRLLFGGAVLGMALLGGHSQMFFLAVLALAVYAIALYVLGRPDGKRLVLLFVGVVGALCLIEPALGLSTPAIATFLGIDLVILLFLGALGLRRLRHVRPRRGESVLRLWAAPSLILAGTALAAIQIVPTASVLSATARGDLTIGNATTYTFSLSHLPLLLFPYLFGGGNAGPFDAPYVGHWDLTELAGYPGLACVVLAFAGLPAIRRDQRAVALALTAFVVFAVMLGESTGVGYLIYLIPPYGRFSDWGRYVEVIDLAVAVFGAYGVAHLRAASGGENRRAVRRAFLAAGSLLLVGVVVPFLPVVARYRTDVASKAVLAVAIPLTGAALAAVTCLLFRRHPRVAIVACCALVAADGLASFGAFFEWRASPTEAQARAAYSPATPASWGQVPTRVGGISRYLFVGRKWSSLTPDLPQLTDLKGMLSANGYEPLAPEDYLEALGDMNYTGVESRARSLLTRPTELSDVLRISLLLAPKGKVPPRLAPGLSRAGSSGGLARLAYHPSVPDAYLVGATRSSREDSAIAQLSGARPFDIRTGALVTGECGACESLRTPGRAGTVAGEKRDENSIALDVHAARPAMLVVSEAFFPGWTARVDGHAAPVLRADGLVLGVPVPPGTHHVELVYRSPGALTGALITALVLLGFMVAIAVHHRRTRRA
jgi:hypothetical protein